MQPHNRIIMPTTDGSATIAIPELNVTYHSRHGAVQESRHVFIQAGLHHALPKMLQNPFAVLEMGFGTGLNALLTLAVAEAQARQLAYTAVELYPLAEAEWRQIDYSAFAPGAAAYFPQLHEAAWNKEISITPLFSLQKVQQDFLQFNSAQRFSLIYYDAFAPGAQPQLWTVEMFQKLFGLLLPGGTLVTYCSKGDVRRALQAAGFDVTKLPGPPGKREMLRAERPEAET